MIMVIRKQAFGSTGHMSSAAVFGAAALGNVSQETADLTLELLLQYGVNHIDTAASYGESEASVGPWMEKHRNKFFLATKTEERSYQSAMDEFRKSLKRLQVESVDLIQLHNLTHIDDWEKAMSEDGAVKAVVELKEQGYTKNIGVTGHGLIAPAMHLRSLEKIPFDSVLVPWNYPLYRNLRYRGEFKKLVETCIDRGVAVQTIKGVTRGPWAEKKRTRNTWYEPLEDQNDLDMAVQWILGQPSLFLNTAGDTQLLPKILKAAEKEMSMPGDEEMEKMADKLGMTPLFVS
jgi:aryl-alcohol dehydrogenase-like predicted oxidoreductase